MKRRDFLIAGAALGVAGLGCLGGCSSYTGSARVSGGGVAGRHWGFVVDVERFNREADMGKIQAACHHAHNVPDIGDPKEEVKWIWGEPFEASFADIPVSNAMDTADAATYQWTHPVVTEVAGDVGEIAPAYRAIGGYVWKDNDYKDGIYNLIPGTYEDMVNTGMTIELKNPEKQPVPDRPTRLYLRQWYYDPDRTNGGNANPEADAPADHWFPVPQGAFTEYGNDRDWSPTEATKAPFYYRQGSGQLLPVRRPARARVHRRQGVPGRLHRGHPRQCRLQAG